ncbi:uncharacterized protein BJ212DRAFT_1485751 [Suillus subaureus]|uniref:Uncharacterized protein n=1 Tax=Suillus subaureus TaxID=48587 RepID=A0A9P7J7T4_9AGAM|nr:uncharacterized protein BJ212DRAFT_1485751 [Suillus subaureus]KAG1807090.1 hypothetical protein BJ212DRAFT_1485751 [Suillus subaureus]
MSLDDNTYSASTLTLLDEYAFKSDPLAMINNTELGTNIELKPHAKAILLDVGSGLETAGLPNGVRYIAAAIVVAYQKGEVSNSSVPELMKLEHDWFFFFLWPFRRAFIPGGSPQSESSESTPALRASEVVADTVPTTSCIVHEHSGCNRIAGMIDIIKHFTKLLEKIMDDLAGIADNAENGILLDTTMHDTFNSYMWCPHLTCTGSVPTLVPMGMGNFQDYSQTGIPLPSPTYIALHCAVPHVLHLSGAAEVINTVYDMSFNECSTAPSENRFSKFFSSDSR